MRQELPSGTVTLLFTDIEGSTKLLDELGDAYAGLLAEHRRVLRDVFDRHGGVEVDTQGDAFFVAFPTVSGALSAAFETQTALSGGQISVRVGVHTGEPTVTEDGYVGMDVHRGARIAAAGHGGQVLISQATYDLAGQGSPLIDLGEHRLKDLSAPLHLWQLGEGDFPPLRTLHQTNLPVQVTPLIGRERELSELRGLLNRQRLVTLTGAGGSGKTRLALHLAAESVEDNPDGVWWVPLAALSDPELVLLTVAQTLGVPGDLASHLRSKRLLLLLDNLEHVIECAPQLAELLASVNGVRLLVTSREPMRIEGEHLYAVEPLAEDAAVMLFVERAAVAEPREAVREICRRLDCLPLAVELAAARTTLFTPDRLLARLGQRLDFLTSGRRDAPARQKTLRATIEWSHDLLSPGEQVLFRRLAVFAGSFAVEAVEAVADSDIDTLQCLVDKSLVRRWGSGRLGMFETVHEFALERLLAVGEDSTLRQRHLAYLVDVGEAANMYADGQGEECFDMIAPERDNGRAALEWALAHDELELGSRLAVSFEEYWLSTDTFEGVRWFARYLERSDAISPKQRARLLCGHGGCLYLAGRFHEAWELHRESLSLYRQLDDAPGIAIMLPRVATEAARAGDLVQARGLAEEGLIRNRQRGSRRGEAEALATLGRIVWGCGEHETALQLMEESLAAAREANFAWWEANTLVDLAECALELGRLSDARRWIVEGLRMTDQISDRQFVVWGLALSALISAESGDAEQAGRLWGAIEAEETRGELGQWEGERELYSEQLLRHGGHEFDRGREEGASLRLADAVAEAIQDIANRD